MTSIKINYGIDLGTTNSAIARMENGEPTITKTDTLKDTMPSCIGFNKKGSLRGGDAAKNELHQDRIRCMRDWQAKDSNFFIEFKRTMGSDKTYYSHNTEQEYNSEQLSAEVLKKLKSFITDDDFQSAVITVPAKFDIPQKDATIRAAKLAGFQYCELLQEPIAASLAYGLDNKNKSKNGYWVVFDFGGGTFDAALVKMEEGIMKIADTDGDNYLGGKNLDSAIVDEILIPHLSNHYNISSYLDDNAAKNTLRSALKFFAEEAKIQLSFRSEHNLYYEDVSLEWEDDDGAEIEIDITITEEHLKDIVAPFFQRAIDISKNLLQRNNLTGEKLDALILVGGPTHSRILRKMLAEQVKEPDTNADPMTVIATGAALYASTVDVSDEIKEASRDKTKIQLDIGYESSTVETEEWVTLKILPEKTEGDIPEKVFAEISRNDESWSSDKTEINDKGEIIEVKLAEDKTNRFDVVLYDEIGNRLEAQPDNFTIIQGMGGTDTAASLPHHIGIELDIGKPYSVFQPVKGLEKNVSLPAKGTENGLKTKMDIRPDNSEDKIRIPLYQGNYGAEGTRAIYNKHIYDVVITGDDLPYFLPENSDVDLTITTDRSAGRPEKLEAYFPYLEYTHEVQIPENPPSTIPQDKLEEELNEAEATIKRLKSNSLVNQQKVAEVEKEVSEQRKHFDQGGTEDDCRSEVSSNLKKTLQKADSAEEDIEWSALEKELRQEFERLEKANNEFGDEKTSRHVDELQAKVDEVIRKEDKETGKDVLEQIKQFYIQLTLIHQLIGFVRHYSKNFGTVTWKNPQKARQLIKQAEGIIADNPTEATLHPVVVDIAKLIADKESEEKSSEILEKLT